MARIRSLKPDFFLDEELGELSIAHRLAFSGLWCLADKAGRLRFEPKKIKAQLFPYDSIDINKLLTALTLKPFIAIYEVEGVKYIQIIKWLVHQNPHHTEKESVIPPFNGDLTVKEPLRNGELNPTPLMNTTHIQRPINNEPITMNQYANWEKDVISAWNGLCLEFPVLIKIAVVSNTRRQMLKKRFTEEHFKNFGEIIAAIKEQKEFLINGSRSTEAHKSWRVNFDWLIKNDENYIKILERKYSNANDGDYIPDSLKAYGKNSRSETANSNRRR